jgi:excisionase family DNA binding protein
MTDTTVNAAVDLLYGVKSIASFLGIKERSAQHLVETKRIPYFKVGKTVCARRSKLIEAMDRLEERQTEVA